MYSRNHSNYEYILLLETDKNTFFCATHVEWQLKLDTVCCKKKNQNIIL